MRAFLDPATDQGTLNQDAIQSPVIASRTPQKLEPFVLFLFKSIVRIYCVCAMPFLLQLQCCLFSSQFHIALQSKVTTFNVVLLHESKCTGKFSIAHAAITSASFFGRVIKCFKIQPSDVYSQAYGTGDNMLAKLFHRLVASAPSVLIVANSHKVVGYSAAADVNQQATLLDDFMYRIKMQ